MSNNVTGRSPADLKICICNVPLRAKPTTIPPFGSMYIVQALRKLGAVVEFYNLDYFRPENAVLERYFEQQAFDIVGISAVVSTAYAYTKKLAQLIKTVSPNSIAIVGGNLASSAEILLKKCDVDFCVIGDGEITIQKLAACLAGSISSYEPGVRQLNYELLKEIAGICFLDTTGKFHFTGYRKFLSGKLLDWPDYSLLEDDGTVDYYFQDATAWFKGYGLDVPPEIQGKKCAWVPTAKGCINRCTFCHRFMRGYRIRPIEQITAHIEYLKEKYNVAVLLMFDEAFGSARRLTRELVEALGQMGVYWGAGSVRARSVSKEIIAHWAANGCKMATFGIESGCQKMLDVMEKNCTVQENRDALKWTHATGIATQVQLVLAMPGETEETIDETITFLKECWEYFHIENKAVFNLDVSATYVQALPGTPLYEYYRKKRLIGQTIDAEERYLLRVSDIDSLSTDHYINGTGQPLLKVLMWREKIRYKLYEHYFQDVCAYDLSIKWASRELAIEMVRNLADRLGIRSLSKLSQKWKTPLESFMLARLKSSHCDSVDFKLSLSPFQILMLNEKTRRIALPLKLISLALLKSQTPRTFFQHLYKYFKWASRRRTHPSPVLDKSLRDQFETVAALDGSIAALPLRKGN